MAKLYIRGHATRGKEVIGILEMLGGVNINQLLGNVDTQFYWVSSEDNFIHYRGEHSDLTAFTLEGFLEKFPYKVGDSVSSKYLKNYKIEKAEWESHSNKVVYKLQGAGWHSVEDLQPYKEETIEETDTMNHTSEINLNHPVFKGCDEIELIIPNGWEFERRGNKMFGVRKQYPKTYEECCKIKQSDPNFYIDTHLYSNQLGSLYKLLICRDAYWKIAGKQMGLGKPWEPDWTKPSEMKYCIVNSEGNITKWVQKTTNKILAFPTEEMRDAFYENFKDLIEECKEFL